MPNTLPQSVRAKIKKAVYEKADEFGYMECGRPESGKFIDTLVEDPEIGLILMEYLPKEKVRTYIKDGVLNAYTKHLTNMALSKASPEKAIKDIFNEHSSIIYTGKGKQSGLFILSSESGKIYVVSGGTALKWETALRRALDIIANNPNLTIEGKSPLICLKLSLVGQALTEADKKHITTALGALGVKAVFCGS